MKVKSNTLPASRVVLDTVGNKTTATLWDGSYTESEIQADQEIESVGATEYEYDLYQIAVQARPGLRESIEVRFGAWYTAAKNEEKAKKASDEAEKIEREMYANVLKMLLDHDFRLLMLEKQV